jgi:hypothetical protein
MARRKGEDTSGAKRRRMPWVAKIKREDPFRPEDSNELHAQCKRIGTAAEHFSAAGGARILAIDISTSRRG